jgi:phage terminase large subunit-like protein
MDRLDVVAGLVLEDGRLWGDVADDFQLEDARRILSGEGPPHSYVTRPRGGSKTTDLAGMSIAFLVSLPPGSQLDWLAADREQGQLAIAAIRGFAERTPYLRGLFDVQTHRVVHRENGAALTVLAADAPSAWGRSPRVAVVDEIAQWAETAGPRRLWEAVSSSIVKHRDGQLVVITTAGAPGHWSYELLRHAEEDSMWTVHEVPGPVPWISEEHLEEQRRRLPESSFRRLHLNEWTEPEDRLTAVGDLDAAMSLDGPIAPVRGVRYTMGLDLGLVRDRTAVAVCHRDAESVICDRLQVWSGTRQNPVDLSEVESWVAEAVAEYNGARVHADPFQAALMIQRLRARQVRITPHQFTVRSNAEIALTLHNLLREHHLVLPDDPQLREELANVRLRETSPGVFRLDHDEGRHDDRAVALGIAAYHLTRTAGRNELPVDFGAALWEANASFRRPRMQWSHQ